jgi:hypothetical protein
LAVALLATVSAIPAFASQVPHHGGAGEPANIGGTRPFEETGQELLNASREKVEAMYDNRFDPGAFTIPSLSIIPGHGEFNRLRSRYFIGVGDRATVSTQFDLAGESAFMSEDITPVSEPATWVISGLAAGLVACSQRRRVDSFRIKANRRIRDFCVGALNSTGLWPVLLRVARQRPFSAV